MQTTRQNVKKSKLYRASLTMKAENVTPILLADSLDSIEKVPSPRPAEVTPEVGPIVSESALKPN